VGDVAVLCLVWLMVEMIVLSDVVMMLGLMFMFYSIWLICIFGSLGCSLKCDMVCCRWFMVSLILLSRRCVQVLIILV